MLSNTHTQTQKPKPRTHQQQHSCAAISLCAWVIRHCDQTIMHHASPWYGTERSVTTTSPACRNLFCRIQRTHSLLPSTFTHCFFCCIYFIKGGGADSFSVTPEDTPYSHMQGRMAVPFRHIINNNDGFRPDVSHISWL